jgi:PAS domain S-box-containing protein
MLRAWRSKKRAYAIALDAMMGASGEATVVVDRAGTIIAANPWAYRILNWPPENGLVGTHVEQLVPTERREKHAVVRETYIKLPVRRPMGINMNVTARRYDGTIIPVEIGLSPLNDWTVAVIKPVAGHDV